MPNNKTKSQDMLNNSKVLQNLQINPIDIINHINSLPKIDTRDINALKERYRHCLEYCNNNNIPLLNRIVYNFLGVSDNTIYKWSRGISGTKEHHAFIELVKNQLALFRELSIARGEVNPIIGMFWQKCYDGLNETININICATTTTEPALSREQLLEEYGKKAIGSGGKAEF